MHCIRKDKHKFKQSPTSNRKARQYKKQMFFPWQWKRRFHFFVLFVSVVFFATITKMQSSLIITGLTVQQSWFSIILLVTNTACFVVTTKKVSNEMRFLVEPLCCKQYNKSAKSACILCTVYARQILPAISGNALTAFQKIHCLSCYSWTPVHSHNSSMKPQETWTNEHEMH